MILHLDSQSFDNPLAKFHNCIIIKYQKNDWEGFFCGSIFSNRDSRLYSKPRTVRSWNTEKAFVSPDQQGITFKNDFVPLFKMGTPLVIVRTQGDIETQRFSGEVYLSAQNLLQIVAVTDECCPELLLPFCTIPVCG